MSIKASETQQPAFIKTPDLARCSRAMELVEYLYEHVICMLEDHDVNPQPKRAPGLVASYVQAAATAYAALVKEELG